MRGLSARCHTRRCKRAGLKRDMDRGTTSAARRIAHGEDSIGGQGQPAAPEHRLILAHMAGMQPASVARYWGLFSRGVHPLVIPGLRFVASWRDSNYAGCEGRNYFNDFLKSSDSAVDYQTRFAKSPGTSGIGV